MIQTAIDTVNGAFKNNISTEIVWTNIAIYTLLGLFGTFIYFWSIIRAGNGDADTFKEFFKIKNNVNTLIYHLIIYFAFILIWILEGGSIIFMLIGNFISAAVQLVGISLNLNDFYVFLSNTFPKGKLNVVTLILGLGITFIVRNIIPAVVNWFKNFLSKKG